MSARAIRALREHQELLPSANYESDGDDPSSSDDSDTKKTFNNQRKVYAFNDILDESEDEEDDNDEDGNDNTNFKGQSSTNRQPGEDAEVVVEVTSPSIPDGNDDRNTKGRNNKSLLSNASDAVRENPLSDPNKLIDNNEIRQCPASELGDEEDLDALLNEFNKQDGKADEKVDDESSHRTQYFAIIRSGMDLRDLDIDYSMRVSLLGARATTATSSSSSAVDGTSTSTAVPSSSNSRRKYRQQMLLFGPTRDGWVKPPHFVGGGMGMDTYDQLPQSPPLPWPYHRVGANVHSAKKKDDDDDNDFILSLHQMTSVMNRKKWYRFKHSAIYSRDVEDFRYVEQSGDFNALLMFVIHHPFVAEPLLPLTTVLYQTNHSHEGLELLRRCLWLLECSSLLSLTRDFVQQDAFMDVDQPENAILFKSIFRLVQVSQTAALPHTALAASRFLLSLDPLRDPMHVLVAMDSFALASRDATFDRWIVDLVDSDRIPIIYREEDLKQIFQGRLLDMPNWSYSYALALFRLYGAGPSSESKQRADAALQIAVHRYPEVVGMLLQALEIDTIGRSFLRDWFSVIDFCTDRMRRLRRLWFSEPGCDTVVLTATLQACELIIKAFIQTCAKLWEDDSVLQWLYDNVKDMTTQRHDSIISKAPSLALARYCTCNPSDFEGKVELFPQDANIIDPNALAHALVMDPNRPRLLRRLPRGGVAMEGAVADGGWNVGGGAHGVGRGGLLGPPTNVIDPDWPILEVFWRSILPWNHVAGVPPPP